MQFLMMTTPDDTGQAGAAPSPELMAEMGRFVEEGFRNGTIIATGGLDPRVTRISSSGGRVTVTDGPFAEAKEAVVGFALINAASREEAIAYSKRFWGIVGDGQGVIQQVFGPGDGSQG
jgi:hypothetical protein